MIFPVNNRFGYLWLFIYVVFFVSCSKEEWQKKGRTNPRDIEYERPVFNIKLVTGKRYAELKEKLIFRWENTGNGKALNPELWLYRNSQAIERLGIADLSQKEGSFELEPASRQFLHMQNLQIVIKQSQSGIIWLDSLSLPILIYDDKQTPVMTMLTAVNSTAKSLELQTEIIKLGSDNVGEISVCMNTTGAPTTSDRMVICNGVYADGLKLNAIFDNLTAATNYYFRIAIKKGSSTTYGKEQMFQTSLPAKPSLTDFSVTAVTSNSCGVTATISNDGGAAITQKGYVYNTTGSPGINDSKVLSSIQNSVFTAAIKSLNASTKYYVAAFATNSGGTTITSPVSFTTPAESMVSRNSCNSLSGVTAKFEYWSGTAYTWADWTVSSAGYSGSCLYADNGTKPALGGYVQFTQNFSSPGFIRFWINTPNSGYNNRVPTISVDGVIQAAPNMIAGQASSFYWAQFQSQQISSGFHTIRLDWSRTGMYYYYKLDEIEFYE